MQNYAHRPLKILITGVSGTGKTTLWEEIARKEKARVKLVFDHQGEFSHRFKQPAVCSGGDLVERTALGGWVVFDPLAEFGGRPVEGFAFFCDYALAAGASIGGRKLVCCDELQKLTSTRDEPREVLALLDTGRRYQIDFIAISQSPNRIHNGIRNQLTRVYTFRQSDKNALAYLEDNGFDPNEIRGLPRGVYLWRDLDSGDEGKGGSEF